MTAPPQPQELSVEDLADDLEPVAEELIRAVHAVDHERVSALIDKAAALAGNKEWALWALTVLLAGACVEDQPIDHVLAWTRDPEKYEELRNDGVPALLASMRMLRGRSSKAAGGDA